MRKTITAVVAIGLIAGAFMAPAAEAGKKKKAKKYSRTVEASYAHPAPGAAVGVAGVASAAYGYCAGYPGECVEFATTAKDKYVKVKVDDASGQKVVGYIDQGDVDGNGIGDLVHYFCGEHPAAVPITAGVPVGVNIYSGTCDDGSTAVVTSGDIKVTFSNKPF